MLIYGGAAHAHWWSKVARVCRRPSGRGIDLSGHGDSDRRDGTPSGLDRGGRRRHRRRRFRRATGRDHSMAVRHDRNRCWQGDRIGGAVIIDRRWSPSTPRWNGRGAPTSSRRLFPRRPRNPDHPFPHHPRTARLPAGQGSRRLAPLRALDDGRQGWKFDPTIFISNGPNQPSRPWSSVGLRCCGASTAS